ncbi:hypothetical protein QBC37DRAFT_414899 [Rhypophila decipiens]|uniref:Uncharacterized protein n=1 Tax=Rhypophila decipiens TaxID=261697 RepID=A0AAN6YJI9_9PEZI|nr:hypothetical protein QBC37DRAFT_414899 [Rhypophila decipiens]
MLRHGHEWMMRYEFSFFLFLWKLLYLGHLHLLAWTVGLWEFSIILFQLVHIGVYGSCSQRMGIGQDVHGLKGQEVSYGIRYLPGRAHRE